MLHRSVRRLVVAPLLVVSFQLPAVTPAHADPRADIRHAQAQVNRLQVLVQRTSQQIAAGTREYQRDQAALSGVTAQVAALTAKMSAQQQLADAGQARVGQLARRMYMNPVDDQVRMALTMDPQQVMSLIRTQGELQQVAQGDSEVVRRANVAKLALDRSRAQVVALAQQAQTLATRAQQKLAELDRIMTSTANQLAQAQAALATARAREEARLYRLALARARAARSRALPRLGKVGCQLGSTAGMANGNLDPAILCPVWRAPGHVLRTDAERAFAKLSQFHLKTQGTPLCVTDSYRSYAAQVDVYRRKPELAAVPGTSNHGWGRAVDLCGGVQTANSPAWLWMKEFGPSFGWHHPAWAEPNGSKPEAWHWEFGS